MVGKTFCLAREVLSDFSVNWLSLKVWWLVGSLVSVIYKE